MGMTTVTSAEACSESISAWTLVMPARTPRTLPSFMTVAMLLSLELQRTSRSSHASGTMTAVRNVVFPSVMVTFAGETARAVTAQSGVSSSVPVELPQAPTITASTIMAKLLRAGTASRRGRPLRRADADLPLRFDGSISHTFRRFARPLCMITRCPGLKLRPARPVSAAIRVIRFGETRTQRRTVWRLSPPAGRNTLVSPSRDEDRTAHRPASMARPPCAFEPV